MKKTIVCGCAVLGIAAVFALHTESASAYPDKRSDESSPIATMQDVELLFDGYVFGPDEYSTSFGIALDPASVLPFSFTIDECQHARRSGKVPFYFTDSLGGKPLTGKLIYELTGDTTPDGLPLLFTDMTDAMNEWFYNGETAKKGWAFVSMGIIKDSKGKNYLDQTDILIEDVGGSQIFVSRGTTEWAKFTAAIDTFKGHQDQISTLLNPKGKKISGIDSSVASVQLSRLAINASCRESFVEVFCRMVLCLDQKDTDGKCLRLFQNEYVWTRSMTAEGKFVGIGNWFIVDGANVNAAWPSQQDKIWGTTAVCRDRF